MHIARDKKKKKSQEKMKKRRGDKRNSYSPDFANRIVRLASRPPRSRNRVIVIAIAMLAGRDRIQRESRE
jgi:hypothetical protein